jgi:ubiquinone/menaquinone biosynthesis C-methylase UbiE
MAEIYDSIAHKYQQIDRSVKRRYTLEETFFKYIGDVMGKAVLDLGCGEGYYTRRIKKSGAAQVVGVDISHAMLELAGEQEKKEPIGIKYKQFDIVNLPKLGEFDMVTAEYLLHYSKTRDDLFKMCKNIHGNLKKDGRFITLNLDPVNPVQPYERYDSTIVATGPLTEGSVLKVTMYLDNLKVCSFNNYYWKKETYERALKAAGFKDIKWHKIIVSRKGIEEFGHEFWKDYLKQPGVILIECS